VAAAVYGQPFAWLYRPDLLEVLARAVKELAADTIELGRKIESCQQEANRVVLRFTDGGSATGDVLIGADGVHSVIRSTLHGSDNPEFTGFIAWRGVIPFAKLPPRFADGVAKTWVGPSGHVVEYPIRCGDLLNFAGVVQRYDWRIESWSTTGSRQQLEADFRGWHNDIQILVRAVPDPHIWALTIHHPLPRWSVGNITLLGDACHSSLPFLGQGATMAIEDGLVLARALTAHGADVASGLSAYELARKERTTRLVSAAAENTKRLTNPILADAAAAQKYLDGEYAEVKMSERLDWVYKYDAANVAI
jgi:salicylate hydroxylase